MYIPTEERENYRQTLALAASLMVQLLAKRGFTEGQIPRGYWVSSVDKMRPALYRGGTIAWLQEMTRGIAEFNLLDATNVSDSTLHGFYADMQTGLLDEFERFRAALAHKEHTIEGRREEFAEFFAGYMEASEKRKAWE